MFEALLQSFLPIVKGVVKGFGAGAFAAGMGYLKNKGEEFDGLKFTRTVVVGGVVGAFAEGFGVGPEKAEEYLALPFVVYGVDVVTKIIWRRFLEPIYDKFLEAIEDIEE